jgi:glycosyltransferase involved in cell wall biosynthesis
LNSISIVVPAYNEERRLPATLDALVGYLSRRGFPFAEIVVVDDGSTDGTAALVERRSDPVPIRLLRNPGNRGKGYAVRHGMLEAAGDWILFTDADLSAPIDELSRLEAAVAGGRAEVAIGSRGLDRSLIERHQPGLRETAGRFFNLVMRLVTGLPFRDTQCGFKLFAARAAREIFRRQRLDGFGFDVEALFLARRLGLRVVEVPVRWSDVEGTKVSTLGGLAAFADLARLWLYQWSGKYR